MLDYRGIEALYTVIEVQSFEVAAKKLYITQSAVSQRIKVLENFYGEPLLIRMQPYRATRMGEYLIGHFKQICLLENRLEQQIESKKAQVQISIALNRDSLETWFFDLIQQTGLFDDVRLEIIADDQELTLDYLRKGLVSACLSTNGKEVAGGKVEFLGDMEYVLVASPKFIKKYFSGKNKTQCLLEAPALKFDKNDNLHERYLEKFFDLDRAELNYQIIPSVRGFKEFALLGYGYGLIPKIDIIDELKKKKLISIYNDKVWKVPLFWHYWNVESHGYQKLNAEIIRHGQKYLDR